MYESTEKHKKPNIGEKTYSKGKQFENNFDNLLKRTFGDQAGKKRKSTKKINKDQINLIMTSLKGAAKTERIEDVYYRNYCVPS